MIIKYQINQELKLNPRCNIFIISYQTEDIYQHLKHYIQGHFQCEQQISLHIEQAAQWIELGKQTQNYDLFATLRAYEIHLSKTALKTKDIPLLQPIAQDIFILKTQEFKHPLLQQLQNQPNCLWIMAYDPSRLELWRYLKSKLGNYELDFELESWFMQKHHIDFSQCHQLLEKIHLSFPRNSKLNLGQIQDLFGFSSCELNWAPLLQAWQKKDISQSMTFFRESAFKDSDLILLVWLMQRQVQIIYALSKNAENKTHIFNQFKCWPKQQQECLQALAYFSTTELEQLLIKLQMIDRQLKSGANTPAKQQLERLFMQAYVNEH